MCSPLSGQPHLKTLSCWASGIGDGIRATDLLSLRGHPSLLDSVDGKCCTTWTRTSMARAKPTNAQRITRLERLSIFGPTTDVYRGAALEKLWIRKRRPVNNSIPKYSFAPCRLEQPM